MSKEIIVPVRKNKGSLQKYFNNVEGQKEPVQLIDIAFLEHGYNKYSLNNIPILMESIKDIGLEHNLVVKQIDKNRYEIVSGHRRFEAIKQILKEDVNNEYEHLKMVYCKVVNEDENYIVTRLRGHVTNLQVRNLSNLPLKEREEIVQDALKWLALAKKEGIKQFGKTRDALAQMFVVSPRTAQNWITEVKNAEQQTKAAIPDKPKKAFNFIKKIERVENIISEIDDAFCELDIEAPQTVIILNLMNELRKLAETNKPSQ